MGVELIRKAVCDRCGKECYHIVEQTLNEYICEQYKIKTKRIVKSVYHYTEIALRGFDSVYGDSTEATLVLCGGCFDGLGEWLKRPPESLETAENDCCSYGERKDDDKDN